jgi:hypothetical protein
MRSALVPAVIAAVSCHAADAREIRHDAMPETFWGTWAPGTDGCKEGDTIVLTANSYVGPVGNCTIRYVTEIPGRGGAIYSARMQCAPSGVVAQKKTANLIIRPEEGGQISAGPTFESLVAHRRCGASAPAAK